jgi:uncharacterized membrane protein
MAVMFVVPAAAAVAKPVPLTVATDVRDELQMACVVISKLVPSEYMPKALNGWVAPTRMVGLAGVTDMEMRVAEVTVRVVLPEIVPEVAVIVAGLVLAVTAVARPLPITVATGVLDEVQTTCLVISRLIPSEYVPEAVNC